MHRYMHIHIYIYTHSVYVHIYFCLIASAKCLNKNPDTFVRNSPVAKSAALYMVILAAKAADIVK